MSGALEYLNALIAEGYEYPDAEWKATCKFKLDADDLRADYDRQFLTEPQSRQVDHDSLG